MISQNLLLTWSSSLFILLIFHQTPQAHSHDCSPSSCGIISNNSSPFRLKDHPKHCGDPLFELACENNVPFVYVHSYRFHVKAINYSNSTIRLADASITNNTCSFPNFSLYAYNIKKDYKYWTLVGGEANPDVVWHIYFMSCPYPLKNSSLFTEVTHCKALFPADGRYGYVRVGRMNVSEVEHMCTVDTIAMTSWKFEDSNNASLSEIHDSLLYGFELSFDSAIEEGFSVWSIIFTVSICLLLIGTIIIGISTPATGIVAINSRLGLWY